VTKRMKLGKVAQRLNVLLSLTMKLKGDALESGRQAEMG